MTNRLLHLLILVSLLTLQITQTPAAAHATSSPSLYTTYQTNGPALPIFYQVINNTSFETGTQPWTLIAYNNFTPGLNQASPGYNDNTAVQLQVNSGNLTTDSHLTLLQDFPKSTVAFGSDLRLRAAGQVQKLNGTTLTDRAEVSLTLSTSTGTLLRIHYVFDSAVLPSNSTSDAFIAVQGYGSTGWISIDRNVSSDASAVFPSSYSTLSTVSDIRLSAFATSQGIPTNDPRIKYYETGGDRYWNTSETVVFDPDADGMFNPSTDWILYNRGIPPTGAALSNDLGIKFVDKNVNYHWDPGEPIVYDLKNEGVYDLANNDPVINGTAVAGSLLQDPLRKQTSTLFDQIELYTPIDNVNWIHNGGFETGDFTGWGNIAGFKTVTSPTHSGSYSVNGTIMNTATALAQSIDGRPAIDSTSSFQASVYIGKMTGLSSSDKADVWLGLVDSSPQATPLSVYYYFKTGTGNLPSNTTDTVNHKVAGYGIMGEWLNLTRSLQVETQYFDANGHTGPYRIEAVLLEISAQQGSVTSANFDDVSLPSGTPSLYYAADGLNSTYVYEANNPSYGSFYLNIPPQQSVVNITTPNRTPLQTSNYTTQPTQNAVRVTISTTIGVTSPGHWLIYATSKNILASLFALSSGSTTSSSSFATSTTVSFASQTRDPLGQPIPGSNVTLLFSAGNNVSRGITNAQGWFNRTSALPSTSGTFTLEAITVSSSYIGLKTIQLTTYNPTPWVLIAYISIAAGAAAVFSLYFFSRRRKKTTTNIQSSVLPKSNKPSKSLNKPI